MSAAVNRFNDQVYPWQLEHWDQVVQSYVGKKLHHGLLLSGQEGMGKQAFAFAVASFLLCSNNKDQKKPCGHCTSCKLLEAGSHPDLKVLEPEESGKQIKIDQVRAVTNFVNQTAQQGGNKVLILGPAENMNANAANALLKNLEEPSLKTFLILYTHQSSGVLPTIKSRCQQFAFATPSQSVVAEWLSAEAAQASMAIALGHGSPLIAKSLIEGSGLSQFSRLVIDLESLLTGQNNPVKVADNWKKEELSELLSWLYVLALDVMRVGTTGSKDQSRLPEISHLVEAMSKGANLRLLDQFAKKVAQGRGQLKSGIGNPNQQLLLESVLIDWASLFGTQ